ncbi:MAG: hypothetical protein JO023_12650 [Chloroflexi bacterium]|nr:hypothetical protein [Chloroflexota bacterium]
MSSAFGMRVRLDVSAAASRDLQGRRMRPRRDRIDVYLLRNPSVQRHQVGIMVRRPLAWGLVTGTFRAGEPIVADDAEPTAEERVRMARLHATRRAEGAR